MHKHLTQTKIGNVYIKIQFFLISSMPFVCVYINNGVEYATEHFLHQYNKLGSH